MRNAETRPQKNEQWRQKGDLHIDVESALYDRVRCWCLYAVDDEGKHAEDGEERAGLEDDEDRVKVVVLALP